MPGNAAAWTDRPALATTAMAAKEAAGIARGGAAAAVPLPQALAPDHDHDHDHDHQHEHNSGEDLCAALPNEISWLQANGTIAADTAITAGTPLVAFADTFRLSSNPTARTTIYLDFDGHTTSGTSWNNTTMGASFFSPAYDTDGNKTSFSNNELTLIQRAWQRIAADFAAFDVNVTTLAPPDDWLIKSNSSDPNYGIRVVMTSYGPSSSTAGGIAYIDSFNWNSDTPCFVYNTSLLGVSEAASHEVGHTLGLSHDGTLSGAAYYEGHGSGETGWAPIMGVGYYRSVTTWDDGTYYNSNNNGSSANYNKGANDLAIISSYNGFGYLNDQEGNGQASANALFIQAGNVSQFGTIETSSDNDWFRFTLDNLGSINLNFDPYWFRSFLDSDGLWGGPVNPYYARISDANTGTAWADNGSNLDLSVELYNSAGSLLASANPTGLAANLAVSGLVADTYFLKLDGVGFGTPTSNTPSGYSDVASIGSYLISGTISGADAIPEISLALAPNFSVSEDGTSTLTWKLSRSGDLTAGLTVALSLAGTATTGVDYSLSGSDGSSVSFAPGAATATVSVDPSADSTVESDETVSLQLAAGSGYTIATTTAVVGTISNDDVPAVTLSLSPASVTEDGSQNLIYTFTRSFASSQSLLVSYTVAGSAELGIDYSGPATSGAVKTITIAANSSTATLTVNPTADSLFEAHETVELSLFGGWGYTIGSSAPVVGTISNDDLPTVSLSVAPASVSENGVGGLVYTFSRDGLTSSALTVNFAIAGTASNGVDYGPLATSITFQANAASASLTVLPIDDSLVESDESVAISLSANPAYRLGTSGAVTGTIVNDDLPAISLAVSPASVSEAGSDGPLVYTFSRSTATAEPLTILYTVAGTATADVDYTGSTSGSITFAAGASTASLTLTPVADSLAESDETIAISLAAGSGYILGTTAAVVGTILNDGTPRISLSLAPISVSEDSASPLVYTFSRSGVLDAGLVVHVDAKGTATAGEDYTPIGSSISFLPGEATATLAITPWADSTVEANETVDLSLVADAAYAIDTPGVVQATILNDDLPVVSLRAAPAAVSEDSGTAMVYFFSRSGPVDDPLTVNYAVAGTAAAGSDYSGIAGGGTSQSLSFAAGSASATLSLTPIADSVAELDETVEVSLQAGSGYLVDNGAAVVGTILNDDLPTVSLSVSPSSVSEGGSGNLVFNFSRSLAAPEPLTVSFSVSGSASAGIDYTGVNPSAGIASVTFAGGSANAQVVIDPSDDTSVESNETVALTLLAGSGYTVSTATAVTGTINNDDLNPAPTAGADTLIFTPGLDSLTGLGGVDTFQLLDLRNSLFASASSIDKVTSFVTSDDRFDSPFRSTAVVPTAAGSVSSLSTSNITNLLTSSRFVANGAATFTVGRNANMRTFLGINDATAGYQSAADAIIEITGFVGSLASLQVL